MTILDENSSFGEWAEVWAERKVVGRSYKYVTSTYNFVHHLENISTIPINKVRSMNIEDILIDLAKYNPNTKKPSSEKLLKNIRQTATAIFTFAINNCDNLYRNPAKTADIPANATKKERTHISLDEQTLVIDTPHRARLSAMIMLLCGLRAGELIALEWKNIDFDNRVIHVCQSTYNINSNKLGIKPKTKNGKSRNVTIPSILYQQLYTEYLRKKGKTAFVSTKSNGRSMHTRSSFERMWQSYLKRLEISFTPHQLRHTYATMLYMAGVDVKSASELLGHSSIEITMKIYTHLTEETKIISISKYNQFLDDNFGKNLQ